MLQKQTARNSVILTLCLFFVLGCGTNLPEGDVKIIDVRNGSEPEIDLSAHKANDVEVYRSQFMVDGYKVRYYQLEQNKLVSHEATRGSTDDFYNAQYVWMSDTSVAIRLYNDSTNKELRFRVFGKGSMSGISDQLK